MLLEHFALPYFRAVAERRIKHSPPAIIAPPRNGEVFILAMNRRQRQINRVRVETHKDVNAVAREFFELVNLIFDFERAFQMARGRVAAVFDFNCDILMPGVLVEITADQFSVLRPFIKSVCRAVNADESLARFYEIQKSRLLLIGNRQLSGRVEYDRVILLEAVATEQRSSLLSSSLRMRRNAPRSVSLSLRKEAARHVSTRLSVSGKAPFALRDCRLNCRNFHLLRRIVLPVVTALQPPRTSAQTEVF